MNTPHCAHPRDRRSPPLAPSAGPGRTTGRAAGTPAGTAVATWYDGWVGDQGSRYHQALAVPAAMDLLDPRPGERVLEIGAGQGVLAARVARAGATYTGVDASPKLIDSARRGMAGRASSSSATRGG